MLFQNFKRSTTTYDLTTLGLNILYFGYPTIYHPSVGDLFLGYPPYQLFFFGHRNLPECQHRQNIATFPIILNSCRLFRISYSDLSQKSYLADASPKPLDLKYTFPIIFESLWIILDQLFSPVIQPSLKDNVLRYQSKTPLLILLLLLIPLLLKYETTLEYQKDKRLF